MVSKAKQRCARQLNKTHGPWLCYGKVDALLDEMRSFMIETNYGIYFRSLYILI